MPLLPVPDYTPPPFLRNGHLQTVFPTLFRPTPVTSPRRERIETPDSDFLDIDWHYSGAGASDRVALISHGLEGSARKKYPLGMACHLNRTGWDVVCLNFRGCSGESNRRLRYYHSGVTDDLHTVLLHVLAKLDYSTAVLIGFSMGGNQTLKYLGEDPSQVPGQVKGAVVFSVPCDLAGSARRLGRRRNAMYMAYFMKGLREKVREKAERYPGLLEVKGLSGIRRFEEFDNKYTAPIHGFRDAADYYSRSSSLSFLPEIRVKTLLVQAADDPFLTPTCYPVVEAEGNSNLLLEIPAYGGHVGFVDRGSTGGENLYWSERRAAKFLEGI